MIYLIEIQTYNNGEKESYGVYPYAVKDEALSSFHRRIGGAMTLEKCETELVMVVDQNGATIRKERWERYHEPEQDEPSDGDA